MNKLVDKWIDDHKLELIEQTRAVVRIPSVQSEEVLASPGKPSAGPGIPPVPPTPACPFGKKVREVEDYFLKIAGKDFGFKVSEHEGYYALVDAGLEEGINKEMLGVVCHLDVVPEGEGWTYPPFSSDIVNNTIYGRGCVDDKGPAVAALFALKAISESGLKFKRSVRLILGLNEETEMKCLEKYCEIERIPDISFTPDGCYPLCNSEFGIAHAVFKKSFKSNITMKSGVAANVVPPTAKAFVNDKEYIAEGKQAHASMPWEGENAASKLISILYNENVADEETKPVLDVLYRYLGSGYYGEKLGIAYEDATGKQTCNLGIVNWTNEGIEFVLDMRCPAAVKENDLKDKLSNAFVENGFEFASFSFSKGFYLDENTEIVKSLMEVYEERTGKTGLKPITMGGGTYARHLPNAVSFGPEGEMDICSCHIPDEHITFDQLLFTTKMIADAIIKLACE